MAQPVFDGHPLEDYLRDSGEASEVIPGGIPESSLQPYLIDRPFTSKHSERMEKLCFIIFGAFESLSSLFSSDRMSLRAKAFAERFKYGVISSSLLSPAYGATPIPESQRRARSPSIPGKLATGGHSRNPSLAASLAESTMTDTLSLSMPQEPETPFWPVTLSFTAVVAALSARFYFIALLLLAGTLYYIHVHRPDMHSKPNVMTPSLQALQNLISAGQLWDSVINDTFSILENEERNTFYGPKSPLTPSSSLRVALSTSLLTTQTQCDNVRQLLSAITSPSELAQLSEMYAPPSPMKSTFPSCGDSPRPLSHPGSHQRTNSLSDRTRKRSTWNGSYAALALAGSPPAYQLTQRREKRRSDLSALLGATPSPSPARKSTQSAAASPSQPLADVSEEEAGMVTAKSSVVDDDEDDSFGAAALGLYRNHIGGGLRTFDLSHRSAPASLTRGGSIKRRTTMSPGSKYTSITPTRHPLSLSSLRLSLQSALGSKRFACSHLLALRFDDDDDVYWEDVRAVMSLLTSTLADASARLSEVLDEVEEHRLRADDSASESASTSISGLHTPSSLPSSPPPARPSLSLPLSHTIANIVSFAPTPTNLSRFATHVNAISAALDDARDQLAQCVASLKDDETHSPTHSSHPSTSSCAGVVGVGGVGVNSGAMSMGMGMGMGMGMSGETSDHPAVQAYERLRRELGLALRECERGRERLVSIVAPPTPPTDDDCPTDSNKPSRPLEGDGESQAPPPQPQPHDSDEADINLIPSGDAVSHDHDQEREQQQQQQQDDASAQLLLSASPAHLPPPGVEQVYAADAGLVGAFTRERSTLSREERIQLVKARRRQRESEEFPLSPSVLSSFSKSAISHDSRTDSMALLLPPLSPVDPPTSKLERWGPGTDVVQELKDVIWKVGERRRKMAESGFGLRSVVVSGASSMSMPMSIDVSPSVNVRSPSS